MEPLVVGEIVGTECPTVFGRIDAIVDGEVTITFTDGKTETYYLRESVRHRVGTFKTQPVFEDWCHRLSPLERIARES